jgi:hypothetical protein
MEYQPGVVSPTGSISEGWDIIRSSYGTYVLMMLVFGIILFIAALVIGGIGGAINLGILAALGYSPMDLRGAQELSTAFLPQSIGLVVNFFTSIIISTISGAFVCGIYKALAQTALTGTAEFGDLFSGFDKIPDCAVVAVIMSGIQVLIGVLMLGITIALGIAPFGFKSIIGADGKPNPEIFGGFILAAFALAGVSMLIQLFIYSLLFFVYPLIADRNVSGGQAVSLSVKAALGNLIGVVLLAILLFLMTVGGFLVCIIGALFVAPILFASIFAAYRKAFGVLDGNSQYNPPPPPNFSNQPGY